MRKASKWLLLLLCGLLAVAGSLPLPARAAAAPPGTAAHFKRAGIRLPQQEAELISVHFFSHDNSAKPQGPSIPLLTIGSSHLATIRTAASICAAQNDEAARAYLRHLHPSHDFP